MLKGLPEKTDSKQNFDTIKTVETLSEITWNSVQIELTTTNNQLEWPAKNLYIIEPPQIIYVSEDQGLC